MPRKETINLQNNEWLSKVLLRGKITPKWSSIIFFIFYLLCSIIFAVKFNAWNPAGIQRGLSNDIPSWGFGYLMQPIMIGALCWIQYSASNMFKTLFTEGIFPEKSKFINQLNTASVMMKHRLIPFATLALSALITIVFVLAFVGVIPAPVFSWLTANPIPAIALSPFYFIALYALIIFLYDLFIVIYTLDKIVASQKIRVEPIHPDNAGGLGSIGSFISNLGFFMSVIGITLLISALYDLDSLFSGKDYALIIYIIIYLILVPIVFFRPIWSTHLAMVKSRDSALHEISEKFNSLYSKLIYTKSKSRSEEVELREELKYLNEMYNLTKSFPTWPYNINNARKYFTTSLSPIIGIIVPPLIDFGIKLFIS